MASAGHTGDGVPVVYALNDMWTDAAVPGGVGHGLAHITIAGAKHHGMRRLEVPRAPLGREGERENHICPSRLGLIQRGGDWHCQPC